MGTWVVTKVQRILRVGGAGPVLPVVRRPEAPVAAVGRGGAPRASLHETSSLRLNFSEAS